MNAMYAVSPLSELSPLEVHRLYKLRVDIFVNEQKCPYSEIDDIDATPSTLHVLAWSADPEEHHHLLGTTRLYPDTVEGKPVSHLGRLAILPEARGTGLGADLMFQTLRLAYEKYGEQDVFLTAQSPLVEYYAAFGFTVAGEEFDDEGVPHTPMILAGSKLASIIDARS
ncbi:GNAT family N-acetyltransferase [Corynebacterium vitaeruminis]|nr:GNAT family N-acetyltransferase [Corynebacterium vitaeruminis]